MMKDGSVKNLKVQPMRVFFRLLVIIVIVIFGSEAIVRIFIMLPTPSVSDRELGWAYKPYATILHTSEGRATNKMNSMGYNDKDHIVNKDINQILVLGDSMTEALQVPQSKNFTSIVEEIAPCFNLYNTGRSGLSPAHYSIVMSRNIEYVKPALSIVVISYSGDRHGILSGNYEIVRDDDNRIIDLKVKEKSLSRLRVQLDPILSKSALATYLMMRVKALLANEKLEKDILNKKTFNVKPGEINSEEDDIHDVLVYLFKKMNSQNPLAVLYIPKLIYGSNGYVETLDKSVDFELMVKDAANVSGVYFFSTDKYIKKSYIETGQPEVGFPNKDILGGHLNELGHRVTAMALTDFISEVDLPCSDCEKKLGVCVKP